MKIKRIAIIILFFVLNIGMFLSCGDSEEKSDKPFGNCPYGAPKAIFKPTYPQVKNHQFQLNSQSAVELVTFENRVALELTQSGCEKPRQEFQFTIPTNTKEFKDDDWLASSLDMLGFMGNLSPDLQPFLMWENALTENLPELKIGLPYELDKGFFVKIDKVSGAESGLLIIALYRE